MPSRLNASRLWIAVLVGVGLALALSAHTRDMEDGATEMHRAFPATM